MSISDLIVVMKDGTVQQVGKPQDIYDDPVNLFVAKFLGTPPINVFGGEIKAEKLYIGNKAVLETKGAPDGEVYAAVRPEGFIPEDDGELVCTLKRVEVMGRDTSIVASHDFFTGESIRAIIASGTKVDTEKQTVAFSLRPEKTLIFDKTTEQRVRFTF